MDSTTTIGNFLTDADLEILTKSDLIELLKVKIVQGDKYKEEKSSLQGSVAKLEKALHDQYLRCRHLEDDRSFLRDNIKKASISWFERKAKLSDSDNEQSTDGKDPGSPDSESKQSRSEASHFLLTEEAIKLFADLKFKNEQLELSDKQCTELTKRLKDYEKVIDDQEVIIHGLEKQLDTYFNDNQKMSKQLSDLHKLFGDLEAINEKEVKATSPNEDERSSAESLPSDHDFREMSGSVSKTYMKLKELIYEKKSLVTEIERLKTLNVELQHRVTQQELRLMDVSGAIQTTWLLVSNLKDEHAKLHTAESILRYELRDKREILYRLREELECSREQWHTIRQMNSETEQEWINLREEMKARRKLSEYPEGESPTPEDLEGAVGGCKTEYEFEPPIDLLVDMGIEYGVLNADDEEPVTAVSILGGEDVHADRLQNLEDQCCHLYQKLMASTARALNLASRLTSLHEHYAVSDDGEEEEEEEELAEEDNDDDENDYHIFETENMSPDSESYDTAYVSEVDGADSGSATGVPIDPPLIHGEETSSGLEDGGNAEAEDSPIDITEDCCDILSRRLITFLPKKIELLKLENRKLEERMAAQQEEKIKIEAALSAALDFERRQKNLLETQLSHLGKCVDELKLERNGKIAEVEEELRRKVEQVRKEEEQHIVLQEQFESLQEKFDQRETLLQLSTAQLEEEQKRANEAEEMLQKMKLEVQNLEEEIKNLHLTEKRSCSHSQECQTESAKENQSCQTDFITENKDAGVADNLTMPPATCNTTSYRTSANSFLFDVIYDTPPRTFDACSVNQIEQLTIMPQTTVRFPFNLDVATILCWTLDVQTEEIMFGLCYDQRIPTLTKRREDMSTAEEGQHHYVTTHKSFQITASTGSRSVGVLSKELVQPFIIWNSGILTKGTITPRLPGQYSLVLFNRTSRNQDVALKVWTRLKSENVDKT